jgi:Protein of unknown function (DUF2591)
VSQIWTRPFVAISIRKWQRKLRINVGSTRIKTSKLTGKALDWAAGQAEGLVFENGDWYKPATQSLAASRIPEWSPSTNHVQCSAIMVREGIETAWLYVGDTKWAARKRLVEGAKDSFCMDGPNSIIASMRCFVASRFGQDVDVPDAFLRA